MAQIVHAVTPAVVRIVTPDGSGSGAVISSTGLVITNAHVVGNHRRLTVVTAESRELRGTVLGKDETVDIAVVKVESPHSLFSLSLANANWIRPGDEVVALGFPYGGAAGTVTVTKGIVSAKEVAAHGGEYIQTDTPINPGNSGGPLINLQGEVVGINTWRREETPSGRAIQNIGFAVSSNTVRDLLPALVAGQSTLATPTPTPRARWATTDRFGPVDGSLDDDNDGFIEEFRSGVSLDDVVAVATFQNPSGGPRGEWDYGFLFRHSDSERFNVLVVSGNGQWSQYQREGTGGNDRLLGSGRASGLKTRPGESNEIRLIAITNYGLFFLNGKLVSWLDFSEGSEAGDVSVISGYFTGHTFPGRSTKFRGFRVSAPEFIDSESGELVHEDDGKIRRSSMFADVKDFIAEATFVNPYSLGVGSWSHGIGFRNPGQNQFQAVTIRSNGTWRHYVRAGSSSPIHEESGRAYLNLASGSRNKIALWAIGNVGLLYVNDKFIAELNIRVGANEGDVWVGTGFYKGDEIPGHSTRFEDFQVWSLD